jgi:hypothetical protein
MESSGVCTVPGVEEYSEFRLEALAWACGVVGCEESLIAEGLRKWVIESASVTEMDGV